MVLGLGAAEIVVKENASRLLGMWSRSPAAQLKGGISSMRSHARSTTHPYRMHTASIWSREINQGP